MMPFNKSYASGIYAFVSALDVDRIGLVELNLGCTSPYAVDDTNGRKDRIKVAIEAYRFMLSGQIGASLSHAVPHGNPIEILVAYSETGPLPFPVSPMYSDYISKTVGLVPQNTTLLYWGDDSPSGVTKKNTIDEIFTELLSKVG
jgi:CRISPR-associated protein Cst2